ncbi:hypothetical protein SAMN05216241_10134 [Limimonas halophila]|uniref:Dual OB-containing domain-containing protein n=1 Tax=Limimonas halophila TaxID=1082479 RepID=A0A1G7KXR2_9PROT|nr:hypothetical protein [Limimonas halophila]SDF41876.1 hypothetical protein SAMN05216241_10134 [Limimonas halophila]
MTWMRMLCLGVGLSEDGVTAMGRRLDGETLGPWMRLVSDVDHEAVAPAAAVLDSGERIRPLDVVDVPVDDTATLMHQAENHIVAEDTPWQLVRRVGRSDVLDALDTRLWRRGESSGDGQHDRMTHLQTFFLDGSLRFVRPGTVDLEIQPPRGGEEPAVRAIFRLDGHRYNLEVIDAVTREQAQSCTVGTHRLDDPLLCISLSKLYEYNAEGYTYRQVTGLIR